MYIFICFVSVCVCMHGSPLLSPFVGSDDNLKELVVSFHHVGFGHLIILFQGIRLGSPRFFLLSWLTSGLIYSWYSLYLVICKVLRQFFISCNSNHHFILCLSVLSKHLHFCTPFDLLASSIGALWSSVGEGCSGVVRGSEFYGLRLPTFSLPTPWVLICAFAKAVGDAIFFFI